MKIYTKTGDDGTTNLFNGVRVPKNNLRVECYGTIDELNSLLGVCHTIETNNELKMDLEVVMHKLFRLATDLATPFNPSPLFPIQRINEDDVVYLEKQIDKYDNELPPLRNFIYPIGTHSSAMLQFARTVSRRAERLIISLMEKDDVNLVIIKFVNRLSDYLFTAARLSNLKAGFEEKILKL